MKILRTTDRNFRYDFGKVFKRQFNFAENIQKSVTDILDDIKRIGDQALIKYTQKFDFHEVNTRTMEVTSKEINAALKLLSEENKKALELAAEQVEKFYKQQKVTDVDYKNGDTRIRLVSSPLERVGIYVPGGKASYPSSVLMSAVPAKVAGVGEIIMCSPWTNGEHNPATLVAAHIAGVKKIFKLGGAQAIAAMAYGTKTIPKVDKVVGPGNIFVTLAKKLVFGDVAIDMMAGPSEIVILGDGTVPPAHVASDLLAQAEHDELACSLLLTTNSNYAIRVEGEVRKQTLKLDRKIIAGESIKKRGLIVLVRSIQEAVDLINEIAPEHVELCTEDAEDVVPLIKNAGAIFVGPYSPEAIGDYVAGPSHILPTNGCAKFSSLLLVSDFFRTTSVIHFGEKSFEKWGPIAAQIARLEGLTGHARSIEIRLGKTD
jgi:histidinol dehydrogenase